MNRKMMRLAFGAKCGACGASGSLRGGRADAEPASRSSSASQPNPAADCLSSSRRVRTGVRRLQNMQSLDVYKFVGRQQHPAQRLPGTEPGFLQLCVSRLKRLLITVKERQRLSRLLIARCPAIGALVDQ